MNVEVLIYAYLAVCLAMICFNIVCIFIFYLRDKRLKSYSRRFVKIVSKAIENGDVTEEHCKYLSGKLKKINNLMAFDKTLEELYEQNPGRTKDYLKQISSVFVSLISEYKEKKENNATYFSYIIKKYGIFQGQPVDSVMYTLLKLVHSKSLYVKENALQAIYSIGDVEYTIKALWILDESKSCYHSKMISDGLLNFTGDKKQLSERLWENFDRFSNKMKRIIVDYFRFSSADYRERIFGLLKSKQIDDEVAYSCIRYFGKYPYEPVYPILMDLAAETDEEKWVYTAITALALASYPGDRTVAVLKRLLQSTNWHIRFNASQSLMNLGLSYTDMIDVFEGHDRYAGEILRYRLDQQKMKEKEAVGVGLVSK